MSQLSRLPREQVLSSPDLSVPRQHTTRFNPKTVEDFGLLQAQAALKAIAGNSDVDVEKTYNWKRVKHTILGLSRTFPNEIQPPVCALFRELERCLPGTRATPHWLRNVNTPSTVSPGLESCLFVANHYAVMFLLSTYDTPTNNFVDIQKLIPVYSSCDAKIFGVADGDTPGERSFVSEVFDVPTQEIERNGFISVELDAYEIFQLIIVDPVYSCGTLTCNSDHEARSCLNLQTDEEDHLAFEETSGKGQSLIRKLIMNSL